MRIGIVWPDGGASGGLEHSVRSLPRRVPAAWARGRSSSAPAEAAEGFEWADVSVPTPAGLRDPALYAGLRLDAALVLTWLGLPDIMAAARPHVRHLISLSDSDGVIGVRVFPARVLSRMVLVQSNFGDRLRTAGWWLRQYLGRPPRRRPRTGRERPPRRPDRRLQPWGEGEPAGVLRPPRRGGAGRPDRRRAVPGGRRLRAQPRVRRPRGPRDCHRTLGRPAEGDWVARRRLGAIPAGRRAVEVHADRARR